MSNFGKLVSFCTGYGADYNPSNSEIALAALTTMQTDSQNAINTVNTSLPTYNNAIAAREAAFKPLSKLTRTIRGLKILLHKCYPKYNARIFLFGGDFKIFFQFPGY